MEPTTELRIDHGISSIMMRETRTCYPPGHIWPGRPVGEPAAAGARCMCGEDEMDESMARAVNWRCEP